MKRILLALFWLACFMGVVEAQGPNTVRTFPSITGTGGIVGLGTASSQYVNAVASTQGYSSAGDGGGGQFIWNASSTTATDSGTVFAATGVSTGRWLRVLTPNSVLSPKMFGAKCDGSTDDSTAMQNTENAAGASGYAIQYPSATCKFATGITMGIGVVHTGVGQNNSVLDYTGTGWAFKLNLPNGTSQIVGPSFADLQIATPNVTSGGGAIQYNNPSNGFTNDSSSQEYLFTPSVRRVLLGGPQTVGTFGIQCSKCFDASFNNNYIIAYGTAIDWEGSDVSEASSNAIYNPVTQAILANQHSSFGNQLLISHNDIPNLTAGSGGVDLNINYRSAYIEYNHMEQDNGSTAASIALTCGTASNYDIHDNNVTLVSSVTPNWLTVSGTCLLLSIFNNNTNASAAPPPALFNSGSGALYWYSSTARQYIYAEGNIDNDAGIPYNSPNGNAIIPPAPLNISGTTLWNCTPNTSCVTAADYGTLLYVKNNAFVLPVLTTNPRNVDFQGPTTLPGGVDVWVCGYGAVNGQVITALDGNTAPTQALTTSNACYEMFTNDSPSSSSIILYNADNTRNGNAFITQVIVNKH